MSSAGTVESDIDIEIATYTFTLLLDHNLTLILGFPATGPCQHHGWRSCLAGTTRTNLLALQNGSSFIYSAWCTWLLYIFVMSAMSHYKLHSWDRSLFFFLLLLLSMLYKRPWAYCTYNLDFPTLFQGETPPKRHGDNSTTSQLCCFLTSRLILWILLRHNTHFHFAKQ